MDTYKGTINEFVDWLTGNDSFTNRNVSGGLPVSGSSIRQLLQERLKKPLIVFEDEEAGLFRMFSSETAKNIWVNAHNPKNPAYDPENKEINALEIFSFERPSEFVLTTDLESEPRYIIKGDNASEAAEIMFHVSLKDRDGQTKSDSITVTYTITNNITGVVKTISESYGSSYVNSNSNPVRFNVYDQLDEGVNSINVNIKAATISNSIDVGFPISLINFSLSSSFAFNLSKAANNDIEIPFEINRSSVVDGSTLEVRAYIDGSLAKLSNNNADAIWTDNNTAARINNSIKVKNIYESSNSENKHVVHTLRLEATMVSGNTIFNSNILYYNFEIASEATDIVNRFVNIGISIPYNKKVINDGELILQATRYTPFTFNWSYYTDQIQNQQSVPITWAIKKLVHGEYVYNVISVATGTKNRQNTLTFIPENDTVTEDEARLVAMYDEEEIDSWPIAIAKSSITLSEATGYDLKLSAYGRSNNSPNRHIWKDDINNVSVSFSEGVSWDSTAGWDNNSFMCVGEAAYANVGYVPFPNNFGTEGRTIEIDFKSEQVNDENDILIDIGLPSAGRIIITPTKASVLSKESEIISTHYKANERIKLAFIFNKTENGQDGNLIYIVNNGILERAASIGTVNNYVNQNGIFKIGGSQSGIRVYMIRCYPVALNYTEAYNNFVYDSDDKVSIINRNNIISGSAIVYEECAKKIDTILIEGDLTNILDITKNKEDSETTVNITRHCVDDPSKDFKIVNGKIRKHGQSTLNYPITSLKIWFNKSATDGINPTVTLSSLQTAMGLNKGRYIMKDGAIPSNKYVLQANYADSSGANNAAIERLIQDTWYNAKIDGEYKLRTAPQLFASGETITHNEDPNNVWVEGRNEEGKTWVDIANKPFPYIIRNSADSFPCAVFYRNTNGIDNSIHFLGQYVFMDDKKSDFVFGERSIYHYYDETDPFCMKTENKDQDTKANRVWNNNNVVRIEVVLLDEQITSYMSYNVPSVASDSVNRGAMVPCDTIKYDDKGNKVNFYWENYFEMIYPDPDDLEVKVNGVKVTEDKFAENSQFREKAEKFLIFLRWITGIGALNNGTKIDGYRVTQAALNEFKNTACQHVDIYKLAAYYIFFLRFGLVDSVERNAQLKTYDGQHWHYEPWDMDIAVGNKNDGGFTFDPPMNRDTKMPNDASTYAFSGRSLTTSNVLWDCLEAWDYWRDTIVPKVAQALYEAGGDGKGLKYSVITNLFDKEYSEKWSEVMYNESEHYKYVQMRGNDNDWLRWLQGAGISHRHWWLSNSMNYYDAKWTVGDFNSHRIYIAVNKEAHAQGTDLVTIKPTSNTFFKFTRNDGVDSLGVIPASKESPAVYDVSPYSFNKKDPAHIYGATFVEELNLSCFAQKLAVLTLAGAYDEVLGAPIKKLNIGIPITETINGGVKTYSGYVSGTRLSFSADTAGKGDALGNIKVLDITGQQSFTNTDSLIYNNNRRTLVDFYAIGSGLTRFTSSRSGNKFGELRLPAQTIKTNTTSGVTAVTSTLNSITMIDSSWEDISFWTTYTTDEVIIEEAADGENDEPVIRANPATFANTGIPASLTLIEMEGSTASNLCAAQLVMGWLDSIAADVATKNPTLSGDVLEEKVLETLADYKLIAENISWGTQAVPVRIYYRDLARLAALNNGNNQNANLKGYIQIADTTQLTPVQVTQLRGWFGESVFNKSNINSGLIIDQQLADEYVQINVGRDAYVDTVDGVEGIYLKEGHSATINATKFILSENTDVYEWNLVADTMGAAAQLVEGADGIMRIVANEGAIGDYSVTVTATKGTLSKSVVIHIVGVTYPDDYVFKVKTANNVIARKFEATEAIIKDIFGNNAIYQNNSNNLLRDIYVMYDTYQDFEFYIETVNGDNKTATLKKVEYSVVCMDTVGTLGWTDASAFKGDALEYIGIDNESYLYYNNGATNTPINGIVLATRNLIPDTIKRYVVSVRITIGGKTEIRSLNILMLYDAQPIVAYNPSDTLYATLRSKINPNLTRALYKTDLMAIDGQLTFSGTINNLVTAPINNQVVSIFKYLPYITRLNMANTSFSAIDLGITDTDKRVLNLANMKKLTELVLTGATISVNNIDESIIDISECSALEQFNAGETIAGIKAEDNILLSTIALGNPSYVYLKNTVNINSVSITGQVQDGATVYIENVNRSILRGFTTFYELMQNYGQSNN